MLFVHITYTIMYSLLCVPFLQAMDPQIESLNQKQMALYHHNVMNIKLKEGLLPTNNSQVNLALIYNKVTFLLEDEVKKLPQGIETLYCLIGEKHFNPEVKPLTKEFIQKCIDAQPKFVQKLFDKKAFREKYADLSQQVEVVNQRIDQLGNDELKSLLHASVTFYSANQGEKREEAIALIKGLREKYPAIIPGFKEKPQCLVLGCCIPQIYLPWILTIDDVAGVV